MSTYELDDELVQEFLGTLHESEDALPSGKLGKDLRGQLPIPTPTKIGAVVRTAEPNYVYVRWTLDDVSDMPWVDSQDDEHRSTEKIGRIIEVLSEGVDL